MARTNAPLVTFAQGLVSPLALARVDLSRLRFAAEIQTNYVPRTLGPMMLRPGTKYIANTKSDRRTKPIAFVFSNDDTAIIDLIAVSNVLQVRKGSDDSLVTRVSVSTAVTNGNFSSSAGWTLSNATIGGGVLTLSAVTVGSLATCLRSVSVSAGDTALVHAIRIIVTRGPVGFRIGTTSGGDEVLSLQSLGTGEHSLAFTPGATTIYVQYESVERRNIIVDSGTIEAAGTMELPIPWTTTADVAKTRFIQSGDKLYIACEGFQQRVIERRAQESWSIVKYEPIDGPFLPLPVLDSLITPSGLAGNITLTSAQPFFKSTHVGSLLRLFQTNQRRTASLTLEDTYTDPIRVTGVAGKKTFGDGRDGSRSFRISVSGVYTGVLTLQRSFDGEDVGFTDVKSYADAATFSEARVDTYDNAIVYYRIGFKTQAPDPTGTAVCAINYPGGGGVGVVRITAVATSLSASAEVLITLSSTAATKDWREGKWSDKYGYPSAVALDDGRLIWLGEDRIIGSISDAYDAFDEDFEGDAGPINRTIGYGPIDRVIWGLSLGNLIVGLGGSEAGIRSGTLDNPITPTEFTIKDVSTQGSADAQAVKIDARGVFIQRSKRRVYQLAYNSDSNSYASSDLTVLLPDIDADLLALAVQRQPDTRIYAVDEFGAAWVLLFEPSEDVICWYKIALGPIASAGNIEEIVVLPGEQEDRVYFYCRRTIDGSVVRFIEKMALERDCSGLPECHNADAHVLYAGASSAARSGLDHLEGETVVVWGWDDDDDSGRYLGEYVVAGGAITQSEATENACIGLPYRARFKSAKLAYGAQAGSALTQRKKIDHLALILRNTHQSGLRFGQNFTKMDTLPLKYRGETMDDDKVHVEYDEPSSPLPGTWGTDSRLCLESTAPKPCTVIGAVISLSTHEKI